MFLLVREIHSEKCIMNRFLSLCKYHRVYIYVVCCAPKCYMAHDCTLGSVAVVILYASISTSLYRFTVARRDSCYPTRVAKCTKSLVLCNLFKSCSSLFKGLVPCACVLLSGQQSPSLTSVQQDGNYEGLAQSIVGS